MAAEERKNQKKIQVWISSQLWDKIVNLGYNSQTLAITNGLEALVKESQDSNQMSQELPALKARLEEIERHNETLKNHNDILKAELDRAAQEKESIQNLYDNYMRQMQTLIQQKAIEAPGEKKKPFWKFW
ncbi:MAG TPA: hypothetical protein VGK06_06500 [Methanosarcina sp.]|jgi:cell shape-determining protein MreC